MKTDPLSKAIYDTLISPNESDSNFEAANVVDGLFAIARAIRHLAGVIEHSSPAVLGQERTSINQKNTGRESFVDSSMTYPTSK